jgi:hypothetical protein
MKKIKTFTCELTGTLCEIVEINGEQICREVYIPTVDELEAEAICIEYLLS